MDYLIKRIQEKLLARGRAEQERAAEWQRSLKPTVYRGNNLFQELGGQPIEGRYLGQVGLVPGQSVPNIGRNPNKPVIPGLPVETVVAQEEEFLIPYYTLCYQWNKYLYYTLSQNKTLLSSYDVPKFTAKELIYTVNEDNPNGKYIQPDFLADQDYLGWWAETSSLLCVNGLFILGFYDDEGSAITGETDNVYNYDGGGTGNATRWSIPLLFSTDGIQWGAPVNYGSLYDKFGFTRFDENDALSVSLFAFSAMVTTYSSDLQIITHKAVDSIEVYLSNSGDTYPISANTYLSAGQYYVRSTDGGKTWNTGLTNENKLGYYTYQSSIPVIENGQILNGVVDFPREETIWTNGSLIIIDVFDLSSPTIVTTYLHERVVGFYFTIVNSISVDSGSTGSLYQQYNTLRFEIIEVNQQNFYLDTVPSAGDEYITIARDINPGLGASRRSFGLEQDPFHFTAQKSFRTNRIEGDATQSKIYLMDETIENEESYRDGNLIDPTYTTGISFGSRTAVVSELTILRSITVPHAISVGVNQLTFPLSEINNLGFVLGTKFRIKYSYIDVIHGQQRLKYSAEEYTISGIEENEEYIVSFVPPVEPVSENGFLGFISEIGRLPPYHSIPHHPIRFSIATPQAGDTSVTIDTKISQDKNVGISLYFEDNIRYADQPSYAGKRYYATVTSINQDRQTLNFTPALPNKSDSGIRLTYKSSVWVYYKDRFQRISLTFFPGRNREYSVVSGAIRNSQLLVSSVNCATGSTSILKTHERIGLLHKYGDTSVFAIEKPNGEVLPITQELLNELDPWEKVCDFFQWHGKDKAIGFIRARYLEMQSPQPTNITIPEQGIFAHGGYTKFARLTFSFTSNIFGIFYDGVETEKTQSELFPGISGSIRFDNDYTPTQRSAGNSSVLVIQIEINSNREICVNTIEEPLVFRIIPNSSLSTMSPDGDGMYNILGKLHPNKPSRYAALWFDPIKDRINIAYLAGGFFNVASTSDGTQWATQSFEPSDIAPYPENIIPCIYAQPKKLRGTISSPPTITIN